MIYFIYRGIIWGIQKDSVHAVIYKSLKAE